MPDPPYRPPPDPSRRDRLRAAAILLRDKMRDDPNVSQVVWEMFGVVLDLIDDEYELRDSEIPTRPDCPSPRPPPRMTPQPWRADLVLEELKRGREPGEPGEK